MSDKQEDLGIFGVTPEEVERSKDILPTFDIGQIETGSKVVMTILDKKPRDIEHRNIYKRKGESDKKTTPVLKVFVDTIFRFADNEYIEIPIKENQTLWLSSKSLSLGLAKIFTKNNGSLEGEKITIYIGTADYKDYGENRCYNVQSSAA